MKTGRVVTLKLAKIEANRLTDDHSRRRLREFPLTQIRGLLHVIFGVLSPKLGFPSWNKLLLMP